MSHAKISAIEKYVIEVVKAKRIEKNISQKDLSFKLGKTISLVGNIENPKLRHTYNLEAINELAILFDCSPRDFLPEKPL